MGQKMEALAQRAPFKYVLPDPYNVASYIMPLGISSKFTDLPWYDNLLKNPEYYKKAKGLVGKVVEMSPSEYIQKAADIFKSPVNEVIRSRSPSLISKYARELKTDEFPMPVLDYAVETQEGLHRALAAMEANIKKMSVLIVNKFKE
jgi:hypothetical protein